MLKDALFESGNHLDGGRAFQDIHKTLKILQAGEKTIFFEHISLKYDFIL
jgi:hypothetical protein